VAPIVVEPEVLAGAGVSISGVGDEVAAALSTLASALPGGAMAGHDTAGLAFGQAYKQAAQALMNAGAAAVTGGRKLGFGVCRCRPRTIRGPMRRRRSVVARVR
jgi:hypothetical protein